MISLGTLNKSCVMVDWNCFWLDRKKKVNHGGALQIIYPRKGIANVSKEVFFKGPFLVMNERAARADDLLPNHGWSSLHPTALLCETATPQNFSLLPKR